MPATETDTPADPAIPPCPIGEICKAHEKCAQMCVNCRRDVHASMTRAAGRKLRKLRALPECSVDKCVEFLNSVPQLHLRKHLASMAWWRFSADEDARNADAVQAVMAACPPSRLEFTTEYLHQAMRALSRLSQTQISAWFGCDNVYQIAELFSGDRPVLVGPHCAKCRLYRLGCTAHGTLGAELCTLWEDKFIQSVAASVRKSGEWRDPCKDIPES